MEFTIAPCPFVFFDLALQEEMDMISIVGMDFFSVAA
jgi:hypothetical protein